MLLGAEPLLLNPRGSFCLAIFCRKWLICDFMGPAFINYDRSLLFLSRYKIKYISIIPGRFYSFLMLNVEKYMET